jgi:elongation factor 1 alpha-like protein
MDETEEERERGVTIELTTRYFSTKNRDFTILDAPGHREFVANMITGAAQANCAVLVIDSKKGEFEAGWAGGSGTTKEHAILARSLGVTQLIVAINKCEDHDWD